MYALITGASSGIGKEIAFGLAEKKMNLILVARRIDRLNVLKQELTSKYGIEVVVKGLDLSKQENCHLLHQETLDLKPEIVINNAGFGKVGFFDQIPLKTELSMLELNIMSLHILTKLFVSTMEKGVILNVGSMAAFLPTPLLATYAASKAYVVSFSQAVNYELKKQNRNLSVLTLCPGPVATEFGQVAEAQDMGLPGISAKVCANVAIKGVLKKKPKIIPSFQMKFLHFIIRFFPTQFILKMSYKLQNKKR
ncbi:MAG: SDR family oxidoreductase [Candidatus Izemoplasmatales bacterium]|jgi:hypothetical protein|nr:SDR family oxidoreductase [Candidatus Izemoplasmatales bacterium]